jgi:hypothetical protein
MNYLFHKNTGIHRILPRVSDLFMHIFDLYLPSNEKDRIYRVHSNGDIASINRMCFRTARHGDGLQRVFCKNEQYLESSPGFG